MNDASNRRFTLRTADLAEEREQFAADVREGLTATAKRLQCRWFYDEKGAALFEEICRLPEYYSTRAESEVLQATAPRIAASFTSAPRIAELGSGSSVKTLLVLKAMTERFGPVTYVPIDTCAESLRAAGADLTERLADIEIIGLAMEYSDGLSQLSQLDPAPTLMLWLGSSIGNFRRDDALEFVSSISRALRPGDHLLMGVDLRKDPDVLIRAYDDAAGVTAAFNKNLLTRINHELGGHFDESRFHHRATWEEEAGRIDMWLVSSTEQSVAIDALGIEVAFSAQETVHTESSHKYSRAEIAALIAGAGLELVRIDCDDADRFASVLVRR